MRPLEFADICSPCKNIFSCTDKCIILHSKVTCNRNFPASLKIGAFIMEKFRVGIIGATGMVGQRFVLLTANHPWFTPVVLAASAHSAGKPYAEAIGEKWHMADPIPESVRSMVVMDAEADAEEIAKQVDFVFCAVNMKKDEIKALEERYAKLECPVVSNNSRSPPHPGRPDGRARDQCGPHPHHRRPAQAPRHQARLHRRQVQLLAAELRARAASAA